MTQIIERLKAENYNFKEQIEEYKLIKTHLIQKTEECHQLTIEVNKLTAKKEPLSRKQSVEDNQQTKLDNEQFRCHYSIESC